jgi:maltose-binding protein MalE
MTFDYRHKFRVIRLIWGAARLGSGALTLLLLTLLAACQSLPGSLTPAPTATLAPVETPAPQTPVESAAPQTPAETATPAADAPITLTLWLPTRFLPGEDNAAGQVWQGQMDAFAQSEDGTASRIVVKQDHGPGGLLDLLRAARPVASSVLPDIIALDNADLEAAARAGLIQPIDALIPADLLDDRFPFVRDLTTINGETFGLIYSADLEHLITLDQDPPTNWLDLLNGEQRYVFAPHDGAPHGGGKNASDAVIAHYLSSAGTLLDDLGQPLIKPAVLESLLEKYQTAQQSGILPGNFLDLTSPDDAWTTWRATRSGLGQIQATRFMSVAQRMPNVLAAPLPGLLRPTASIGRGWALAVVTRDARRQAAVARLLQYLLAAPTSSAWTQAAGVLPGRQSALDTWDQASPYTSFIRDQLLQAQAAPPAAVLNVIGPALRKAVDDVLTGRASPGEAAQDAAAAVNGKPPQ